MGLNLEPDILKLCNIKSEGDDDDRSNRDLDILNALFMTVLRERFSKLPFVGEESVGYIWLVIYNICFSDVCG